MSNRAAKLIGPMLRDRDGDGKPRVVATVERVTGAMITPVGLRYPRCVVDEWINEAKRKNGQPGSEELRGRAFRTERELRRRGKYITIPPVKRAIFPDYSASINNPEENDMSLEVTDREAAAVAVAPRVQLADIEAAIAGRYEGTADKLFVDLPMLAPMTILSVCILVMHNGFTVIGKSAPASPENFNAELGKKFAYEDAVRQLWPLMGFALRDRLAAQS